MAYRPPVKSGFETVRTIGKFRPVKVKNQKAVKVLWRENKQVSKILLSNCEDDVIDQLKKAINLDIEYMITMTEQEDKILNFHPATGQWRVMVHSFPARKGEPPVPKTSKGKFGHFMKFSVLLEVQTEELKELTIPVQPSYDKLVPMIDPNSGDEIVGYLSNPEKSKHTKFLDDLLEATGVWEMGAIKWSSNLLPELERRMLSQGREFDVVMKDGWVDVIYPLYDYSENEKELVVEDDDEETEEEIDWD